MKFTLKNYIHYFNSIFILGIFLWLGWIAIGKSRLGIDDANIYFIYMRNISEGLGFVYQKGDGNVEGFSSVLWTLIGSILYSSKIDYTLLVLNLFIILSLLFIVYRFIIYNFRNNAILYYYTFCLILYIFPGFISWNVLSLLETGLWTFLITCSVILILYQREFNTLFNTLIFLLIFTRPESMLLSFILIFWYHLSFYYLEKIVNFKNILFSFAVLFSGLIILFTWRYLTFNYLFPNTYYAKVTGSIFYKLTEGFKYDKNFILENIIILNLIILSFIYIIKEIIRKKEVNNKLFKIIFLVSILIFSLFVPIYVGGDHFGLYRFMQPYVPVYILLLLLLIDALNLNLYNKIIFLVLSISTTFCNQNNLLLNFFEKKQYDSQGEWNLVKSAKIQSDLLNNFFSDISKPRMGLFAAGGYTYFYKGYTIDLLGLNNVSIAHAPKNDFSGPKNHNSFNKHIFYNLNVELLSFAMNISNKNIDDKFVRLDNWGLSIIKGLEKENKFKKEYSNYIIRNNKNNITLKAIMKKKIYK